MDETSIPVFSGFNIETAALLPDLFSVSAEAVAEHLKS
jgi:hypothetical protein